MTDIQVGVLDSLGLAVAADRIVPAPWQAAILLFVVACAPVDASVVASRSYSSATIDCRGDAQSVEDCRLWADRLIGGAPDEIRASTKGVVLTYRSRSGGGCEAYFVDANGDRLGTITAGCP